LSFELLDCQREATLATVADSLAAGLREAGVELVYGLPGGENVEVIDALRRVGIRFVLVHHEASAAFMADATARLTGTPGVCLTTLGPGAANAVVGVAHAYLDRAPVLILTAQVPEHLHAYHTHQLIDLPALVAPITKGSLQVRPENAWDAIPAAIQLAMSGRPGPVHVQISNDDAAQPAPERRADHEPVRPDAPAPADFTVARALFVQARRPAIVVGLGLEPERPYDALRRLAEVAGAPVITTPKAKGALPDDHPLAAGTIGLTRTDPAYAILDEADCILAAGFDVVELVKPWDQRAPLIWLAPWANADPELAAHAVCVGRMRPTLEELATVAYAPAADWGAARVAHYRAALARQTLPTPAPDRMLPQAVLAAIRRATPRDAILTVDVGSHKILASLTWPTYTPNSFLVSNGLSSMGSGLPAAIAAGIVSPGRTIICATGDAGLAMTLGELGTLARSGQPVIMVVFNDAALDLIRAQQLRAGKQVYGVEFANPDFMRIAEAYGIDGYRVNSEEQCAAAVAAAIAAQRPALIEAMIDPVSYPTTPRVN
jgi:acetolactate synthase I/II/III large subunit